MSDNTITIQLVYQHGTPLFVTANNDNDLNRIFGGVVNKKTGLYLFPAYLPFLDIVLSDLRVAFKDRLVLSDQAKTYVQQVEKAIQMRDAGALPDGFEFATTPFAHQTETVVRALYEPRTAILFDCGLGKTKTAIDVLRAARLREPDTKALIVVPAHLPRNWAREFERHAPGEFNVLTLLNKNNKTLDWQSRRHIYRGSREHNPPTGAWNAMVYPDILYTPLENPPETLADLEREYLEMVDRDEDTTKHRAKMRREAKKLDVVLTGAAKRLEPVPTPAADYDVVIVPTSIIGAGEELSLVLKYVPFNAMIFDEAHALRTPTSAITKATLKLAERARRVHLMTGTPSLGSPMHLYALLACSGEFLVESWWKFRKRYTVLKEQKIPGQGDKTFEQEVAYKAMNVLNHLVSMVAVRKRAEDCLDLPAVRVIDYDIDVSDTTKDMYNEMVTQSALSFTDGRPDMRVANAADRINKLFQLLSGFYNDSGKNYELCDGCPNLMSCVANNIKPYTPGCVVESSAPPKTVVRTGCTEKRDACVNLAQTILDESDSKVIIWCTYTEEIDMLEEEFQRLGLGYVRVDGRTKDKVAAEDKFNNDPDCRIYLSQISTGVGITLTSANYTIYYNVTFDLSDYEQSRKRNERISQERHVTVYHITIRGSVTDFIFRSLRTKQEISDSLTDKIQCSICAHNTACMAAGINPFDDDCVYSTKGSRVRIRPSKLE